MSVSARAANGSADRKTSIKNSVTRVAFAASASRHVPLLGRDARLPESRGHPSHEREQHRRARRNSDSMPTHELPDAVGGRIGACQDRPAL